MTLKISKKSPLTWLYAGGVLLLLVAAWLWCFKLSVDPERVFWETVERSLATRGVTISSEQENNGTTAKQHIRFSLGAENLSHTFTTLSQKGTVVKSETLGTPTRDYTRYIDIKTDQKKSDGKAMDFSKILGVWAGGQEGSGQMFTQAVFGAALPVGGMGVPFGNLAPEARAGIIKQIKDDVVYQVAFDKTQKKKVKGRMHYTYKATLQPVAYVALMKRFSQSIGLHGLDQVDPADYKGQKPFSLEITIDARAKQVVAIKAADSGKVQTYSGHDLPVQIDSPKKTITGAELQKRLSSLQ